VLEGWKGGVLKELGSWKCLHNRRVEFAEPHTLEPQHSTPRTPSLHRSITPLLTLLHPSCTSCPQSPVG
jgi:hypothetical protein